MAPEVGLHPVRGLCTPWDGKWRVDLAAGVAESVHVIEVKGSLADLTREDLGDGKWQLDYARHGLTPWLAHADVISPGRLQTLPRAWGLLSVAADGRVHVTREPQHTPNGNVASAYRALAQVLTAQALPTLFGLKTEAAMAVMAEAGVDRPWRAWEQETHRRQLPDDYEDAGSKIL